MKNSSPMQLVAFVTHKTYQNITICCSDTNGTHSGGGDEDGNVWDSVSGERDESCCVDFQMNQGMCVIIIYNKRK